MQNSRRIIAMIILIPILRMAGPETECAAQSKAERRAAELVDKCDSGDKNACRELAKIVAEAGQWYGVYDAVRRLNDQALLAEIAVKNNFAELRLAAAAKLTDQSLLSKIALDDNDAAVRAEARASLERARLGTSVYYGLDCAQAEDAVRKLSDPTLIAQAAASDSKCAREVAFESLSELPDEVLDKIETDQATRDEFTNAMKDSTVMSLSGFIKHHPDSIRVRKASNKMWQLFLTEFPEDKFECSTTLRRMMYPDEQGLNLPTAIREGRPFVISFSPKMVQGESVTVQFRELAGNGAIIDYLSAAVTTPDGKEYHQDGDSVISITVPPYGRASYTWTGSYWMKGASVNLRFDDSHSSMDTLWVATQLNSN